MSRKLLAAAPLAFALAACHPQVRSVSVPAPISSPVSAPVPVPVPVPDLSPSPGVAATPMCDASGRPLAGNVRTKSPAVACK